MTNYCLVCKKPLSLWGKQKEIEIYSCKKCGLGKTNQFHLQDKEYYRDETYIEEENLFKNIFQKRVEMILKVRSKPGKALEIGCSTGILLSLLKTKGWEVQGIEISKKSAQIAVDRGLDVFTRMFEKEEFKQKYDLIIINHTLEHMADPLFVIKKIYSLLSPQGILLLGVPNFGGFSARILKTRWPMLLPKEHLWHFTTKSLSLLLTENHFKILKTNQFSGIWDLSNPLLEMWQSLIGLKKRFIINLLTALPSLIISKLGLGAGIIIVARKIKK